MSADLANGIQLSAVPAGAVLAGAPMTPNQQQAQQMAERELGQGKYHVQGGPSSASASPSPSVATPTPTPKSSSSHHSSAGTILLVILLIVIVGAALLLILRRMGKPRGDKSSKPKGKHLASTPDAPLTGAALLRHNAEQAARAGNWQGAIRERFRAVIATLDERSLLPERKDRTADEAARDAGNLLPQHSAALLDAARAFDEVEYGEYLGSAEGYAVISAVDDAIAAAKDADVAVSR